MKIFSFLSENLRVVFFRRRCNVMSNQTVGEGKVRQFLPKCMRCRNPIKTFNIVCDQCYENVTLPERWHLVRLHMRTVASHFLSVGGNRRWKVMDIEHESSPTYVKKVKHLIDAPEPLIQTAQRLFRNFCDFFSGKDVPFFFHKTTHQMLLKYSTSWCCSLMMTLLGKNIKK